MWQGMKSVMVFEPKDSEQETERKFTEWLKGNDSICEDRVPTPAETRLFLDKRDLA